MRRVLIATMAAAAIVLGGTATAGAQSDEPGTIVEIAQSNPELSTLVTAVTEAGLVETLSGPGPFTVFAPTNAAFEALPAGTLDTLLADPTGQLAQILKQHVMSGAVDSQAAIAAAGGTVETLGGPVTVELEGDSLVVGGATVVTADVQASNGVVHVIDAVITETAAGTPSSVEAGNSGLAASNGTNGLLLAVLAGVAAMGIAGSALTLQRARRRD
jgi:uncharacterized surface protein with fasciclin (FAS1) repeats